MRGLGMGIAVFLHWCVNAVISFTFPVLIDGVGGAATFLLFAVVNAGAILFAWRLIPETSERSLEELEEDFRRRYA
jgi:major inositol transporter-like SP family MFS transporter